jgi:trehalose utilization protein
MNNLPDIGDLVKIKPSFVKSLKGTIGLSAGGHYAIANLDAVWTVESRHVYDDGASYRLFINNNELYANEQDIELVVISELTMSNTDE